MFTVVNIACLALRVDGRKGFFKSPGYTPAVGGRRVHLPDRSVGRPRHDRLPDRRGLLLVGVALWVVTWLVNRGQRAQRTGFRDIDHMEDDLKK